MAEVQNDVRLDRELDQAWSELTAPQADFEVGHVEVGGQRLRCYSRSPATLSEVWASTSSYGDQTYLVYERERVTYAQAHVIVGAAGGWLHRQGVRAGDRVAIAMRNYPEWLLIYWACLSVGATVVGLNAWSVAEELAVAIRDAAPKVIFCDAERLVGLQARPEVMDSCKIVLVRADAPEATPWREVATFVGEAPHAGTEPDDDACIFYTSGTTGISKGARLTHRSCTNNLMNIRFALSVQALAIARASGSEVDLGAGGRPVALVTTPLFHVTANNCLAHLITAVGGTLVLMYKWQAGEALRLIEAERVTTISGAPTMTRELLSHPDVDRRDLTSLSTLTAGGAQLPPDLVAKVDEHSISARPSTGYGMTEASGIVTAVSGEFLVKRPESCGRAMPTFEIRAVGADRAVLPAGTIGEICIRGVGVIKGYLNRPDATAEAIVGGWLHTGDIGRVDHNGYVYLLDRKKDMIIRGGENVYCAEVEAALFRHPAVSEACAFGLTDDRLGEVVCAAVVLAVAATADALREHAATHLARYKVPQHIWVFQSPLPRNASGKILRRELRSFLHLSDAK